MTKNWLTALPGIAALGLVLGTARPAWAHAHPTRMAPAPGAVLSKAPAKVYVWFDDAIQPGLSWLQVKEGNKVVSVGRGQVDPKNHKELWIPLAKVAPGKCRVDWHALADDGHPTHGTLSFTIRR
ncbi:MAG: copper resistance protein CopC [Cyanobacteria bacterium REEB65]|nr:copper resistance protein CopC [Cyanobacteria bacterium REEB65]